MFSKEFNLPEKKLSSIINVDRWIFFSVFLGFVLFFLESDLLFLYLVHSIFQKGAWCFIVCIAPCYRVFVLYSIVPLLIGLVSTFFCSSYCQFYFSIVIIQWLWIIILSYKIPFSNVNTIPLKFRLFLFICSLALFSIIWILLLF